MSTCRRRTTPSPGGGEGIGQAVLVVLGAALLMLVALGVLATTRTIDTSSGPLTGAADRLLEPDHPELVEHRPDPAGLPRRVAAIGVDQQPGVIAGQFAQPAHPLEVAGFLVAPRTRRS